METAASTEVGTSIEEKRTEMQTSCTTQPCATAGGDIPALVDHAGLNRHTCLASQTTTHSIAGSQTPPDTTHQDMNSSDHEEGYVSTLTL